MLVSALWVGGYLLGAIAMAASGYFYWENRNVTGMRYLLAAALIGTVQSFLYFLLLISPALLTKILFWKLFSVLGALVVFCWYLFTVVWTGRDQLASTPALAAVAAPLLVGSVGIVTNTSPLYPDVHSLFWSSVSVANPDAVVSPLTFSISFAAATYDSYVILLAAGSIGLIAEFTFRPDQQLYRWRNTMLVLAGSTAVLFGIGLALLESPFEPQPLVYVLAHSFVVLGIIRSGTYDVVSLPENSLIEAIEGGVIVYDTEGLIIELNERAGHVLSIPDRVVGRPIGEVVALAPQLPTVNGEGTTDRRDDPGTIASTLDGYEFSTADEETASTFLVRVSELTDDQGRGLGWTVLLYDVTDLRQKQQELDLLKQVLSRVLRHNVRNDLSVVKANAQMLENESSGRAAERLRTIQEKSDNLLDASEKARTVERLLDGERSRSTFDVVLVVRSAVETVHADFPAVEFDLDLPGECPVRAHWALSQAIENVVENAAMHNDADQPTVSVTVENRDQQVAVRVVDNGPGIPYSELEVLERNEETALKHGSSLGLWLITWIVDLSGGEIDFENTGDGCTVTVILDHADATTEGEGTPNLGVGGSVATTGDT